MNFMQVSKYKTYIVPKSEEESGRVVTGTGSPRLIWIKGH